MLNKVDEFQAKNSTIENKIQKPKPTKKNPELKNWSKTLTAKTQKTAPDWVAYGKWNQKISKN